jgi:hypothetical protein
MHINYSVEFENQMLKQCRKGRYYLYVRVSSSYLRIKMQIISYAWVLHTTVNPIVRRFRKPSYNPCLLSRIREFYAMNHSPHELRRMLRRPTMCYVTVYAGVSEMCRDRNGRSFKVGKKLQSPLFMP